MASPPTWSWRRWTWWSRALCAWPLWSDVWAACCSSILMAGRMSSTSGWTTSPQTSTPLAGVNSWATSSSRLLDSVNTWFNCNQYPLVWCRINVKSSSGCVSHFILIEMLTQDICKFLWSPLSQDRPVSLIVFCSVSSWYSRKPGHTEQEMQALHVW